MSKLTLSSVQSVFMFVYYVCQPITVLRLQEGTSDTTLISLHTVFRQMNPNSQFLSAAAAISTHMTNICRPTVLQMLSCVPGFSHHETAVVNRLCELVIYYWTVLIYNMYNKDTSLLPLSETYLKVLTMVWLLILSRRFITIACCSSNFSHFYSFYLGLHVS